VLEEFVEHFEHRRSTGSRSGGWKRRRCFHHGDRCEMDQHHTSLRSDPDDIGPDGRDSAGGTLTAEQMECGLVGGRGGQHPPDGCFVAQSTTDPTFATSSLDLEFRAEISRPQRRSRRRHVS